MDPLRPSKLWKGMSPERRLQAARAFWEDEDSTEQQAEAVGAIAQALKFRPKSAAALPLEKRARYLAGLPTISDLLASRLLIAYHLATQRPMMSRFLDALGISHQDGLIADDEAKSPERARLAEAVKTLRSEFSSEAVNLYFSTLLAQDPDTWGGLADEVSASA